MKAETTPLRPSLELRASRFDLVSQLADDLAHEIKNPLHAMVINLEVLRRRVTSGAVESALGRADVIEHELQRVHRLIDQVLQLLRPERAGTADADLRTVLDDIAPLLAIRARAARLAFRQEQPDSDIAVHLRPESLKLALLALSAAVVAALPGNANAGELVLRTRTDGAMAHVAVAIDGAPRGSRRVDHAAIADAISLANALLDESGGAADYRDRDGQSDGFALVLLLPCSLRA